MVYLHHSVPAFPAIMIYLCTNICQLQTHDSALLTCPHHQALTENLERTAMSSGGRKTLRLWNSERHGSSSNTAKREPCPPEPSMLEIKHLWGLRLWIWFQLTSTSQKALSFTSPVSQTEWTKQSSRHTSEGRPLHPLPTPSAHGHARTLHLPRQEKVNFQINLSCSQSGHVSRPGTFTKVVLCNSRLNPEAETWPLPPEGTKVHKLHSFTTKASLSLSSSFSASVWSKWK